MLRKKIILFVMLFILPFSMKAWASEDWPEVSATIQADGAILMDAKSGAVLYGKNEYEQYYPASITKVLTAILVLENVENLDEMVEFSSAAVGKNLEVNSTVIAASAGDRLSVRDCLYCLLLHSANDCANALAEHVSGSNEAFAELMNEKARELGCINSNFKNPSGLNDPEHYTSAYDMALIMQYAISNERFREIDAVQAYTHAPIKRYPDPEAPENTVYAHHRMMRRSFSDYYEGVFAGKTGYTTLAGNTLVTAAERDGVELIVVILNGHRTQYSDTKKLFDFGFENFTSLSARSIDSRIGDLSSSFQFNGSYLTDFVQANVHTEDYLTVPKEYSYSMIQSSMTYDLLPEEREEGYVIRLDYHYGEKEIGKVYIQLSENILETYDTILLASPKDDSVAPENIALSEGETAAIEGSDRSPVSRAPIYLDRINGMIVVQKPIIRVLTILLGIGLMVLLYLVCSYGVEVYREHRRIRRRRRLLKNTKDLSLSQKTKRDLILNKKRNSRHKWR